MYQTHKMDYRKVQGPVVQNKRSLVNDSLKFQMVILQIH